jgi:hypothetical protein
MGAGDNQRYTILVPARNGNEDELCPAALVATLPLLHEPTILGCDRLGTAIFVKPLYALPSPDEVSPLDQSLTFFTADSPRHAQIDLAMTILNDPGLEADIHRYRLLDRNDRLTTGQEINHLIDCPALPSRCTSTQQGVNHQLALDRASWLCCRACVEERLRLAAAITQVHTWLAAIFGTEVGYPPGMYFTRATPARIGAPPPFILPIRVCPEGSTTLNRSPHPPLEHLSASLVRLKRELNLYEAFTEASDGTDTDAGLSLYDKGRPNLN